jgi:hypothetical protein
MAEVEILPGGVKRAKPVPAISHVLPASEHEINIKVEEIAEEDLNKY